MEIDVRCSAVNARGCPLRGRMATPLDRAAAREIHADDPAALAHPSTRRVQRAGAASLDGNPRSGIRGCLVQPGFGLTRRRWPSTWHRLRCDVCRCSRATSGWWGSSPWVTWPPKGLTPRLRMRLKACRSPRDKVEVGQQTSDGAIRFKTVASPGTRHRD